MSREPYYLSPPYRGWSSRTTVEQSGRKHSEPRPTSPTHLPMHLQDHAQPWARYRHRRPSSLSTHTHDLRGHASSHQPGCHTPGPSPPPRGASCRARNRQRPPPLAIPSPSSTSSGSRGSTPWYLATATPKSATVFDTWSMLHSPGSECRSLDMLNRSGPDYRRLSHSYCWYDNPSCSSQSSLASTPTSAHRVPVHHYQPQRSSSYPAHYYYHSRGLPGYATPVRTQHYVVRCAWTCLAC